MFLDKSCRFDIFLTIFYQVFLEVSQNSQKNTCARVSFFNKVAGLTFLIKAIFVVQYILGSFVIFTGQL